MSFRNKGLSKLQGTPWHIEYLRKPENEKARSSKNKGYGHFDLIKHFPPSSLGYECSRELFQSIEFFNKAKKGKLSDYEDAKKRCSECVSKLNQRLEIHRFCVALADNSPIVRFAKLRTAKTITIKYPSNSSPTIYDEEVPLSFYRFVEYAKSNGYPSIVNSNWTEKIRDAHDLAGIYAIYHVFRKIDLAISAVNPSPNVCTAAKSAIKKNGDFDTDAIIPFLQDTLDSILYVPQILNSSRNVYRVCSSDCKKYLAIPRLGHNKRMDLRFPKRKDSTIVDDCFSVLRDTILYTPIDR